MVGAVADEKRVLLPDFLVQNVELRGARHGCPPLADFLCGIESEEGQSGQDVLQHVVAELLEWIVGCWFCVWVGDGFL